MSPAWRSSKRSILVSLALVAAIVGIAPVTPAGAADLTASGDQPSVFFDDTNHAGPQWRIQAFGANAPNHLFIADEQNGGIRDVIQLFSSANNLNSLKVDTNGNVHLAGDGMTFTRLTERLGISTTLPQGKLHISGGAGDDLFAGVGPDLAAGPAFNFGYAGFSFGRGAGFFNVRPDAFAVAPNPSLRFATNNLQRMIITNTGNVGIGTTSPTNPLQMASGARVTAGGVWTDASSREYKQDIQPLTPDEARVALAGLDPVKFAYRADPAERHVGFVAEDVPALVATADRKGLSPMDIVAVLTRVVQEQQRVAQEQQRAMQEYQAALVELRAEMAALRQATGRPAQ